MQSIYKGWETGKIKEEIIQLYYNLKNKKIKNNSEIIFKLKITPK